MKGVTKVERSFLFFQVGSSHDVPIGHRGGLSREVIKGMSSISRDISASEAGSCPLVWKKGGQEGELALAFQAAAQTVSSPLN